MNKIKLKTLLYISWLINPKYPSYFLPTYLYFVYRFVNATKNRKKMSSICTIPCVNRLIEYYLTENADSAFDENNCVVIPESLNKNLINNSFNLVRVNFKNNEQEFRIAHAIPIGNLQNDELLMSEVLFNNLHDSHEYLNNIRLCPINQKYVKIAQDVEVALINTQHEINHGVIDLLLKNYFKTPRILYKGDIFAVNIAKYAPDFICSSYELNFEFLYFKCRKISTNSIDDSLSGYFVVVGESTLKQGPNIRGYLPISIFNFCNNDLMRNGGNYADCLISKCPRGLEEYLEKIDKAVRPFLQKNKLHLQPAFLLQGNKGVGKNAIITALAAKIGMHVYKVECSDIQTSTSSHTETRLTQVFMKSKLTAPCFLVLNNFEIYGKDAENNYDARLVYHFEKELNELFHDNNFPIILMCLSNTKDVSPELCRIFLETFKIEPPNQAQRTSLLKWLMKSKSYTTEINLDDVAAKTPGFMLGDLDALLYHSMKSWLLENDGKNNKNVCLRREDFEKSLDNMQKSYTSSIGAPKVPKVLWSDVGGLIGLKQEIMRTINLPLQHPKLLKITGLKRSGILLFGPPGTGKTLIAKAVATECGLCFLSVKGPELLNMYVGQSEKNVRQVFERARDASPCIIFFDELDSLAPNRGISGDSGGVMDRVVSQLLSEMDGLNEKGTVFVIGATNRPDLLDPALLRPGRFDKLLYVGPCADADSKVGVLKALTRKFSLNNNVELSEIAKMCPEFVTGADLYSVCANAWFSGVRKTIQDIENGLIENKDLSPKSVTVNMDDFIEAVKNLKPSISEEDIKYFNFLKEGNSQENNKNAQNNIIEEEVVKKDENTEDDKNVKKKSIKRTRTVK